MAAATTNTANADDDAMVVVVVGVATLVVLVLLILLLSLVVLLVVMTLAVAVLLLVRVVVVVVTAARFFRVPAIHSTTGHSTSTAFNSAVIAAAFALCSLFTLLSPSWLRRSAVVPSLCGGGGGGGSSSSDGLSRASPCLALRGLGFAFALQLGFLHFDSASSLDLSLLCLFALSSWPDPISSCLAVSYLSFTRLTLRCSLRTLPRLMIRPLTAFFPLNCLDRSCSCALALFCLIVPHEVNLAFFYYRRVVAVLPLLPGGSAVAARDRAGVPEGVPGGAARGEQAKRDHTSDASKGVRRPNGVNAPPARFDISNSLPFLPVERSPPLPSSPV